MSEIIHKIRYEASIDKVFEAITTIDGLKGWYSKWVSFKEGNGKEGSIIRFGFGDDKFESLYKVKKAVKNKTVEWESIDEPGEWTMSGSNVLFELKEEVVEMYDNKKMTVINFKHSGISKTDDFVAEMNSRWAFFLLSLKYFLENGKGMPVPDDIYM